MIHSSLVAPQIGLALNTGLDRKKGRRRIACGLLSAVFMMFCYSDYTAPP